MLSIKLFVILIVPAFTFAQNSLVSEDENKFYSSRYDNIDVETIFRSARLLSNYVDCLLDKKPCPPEGKDLKRVLPHALRTKCARCTKIQKDKALDVITRLYYHHPSTYLALAERYDPTGEYTKNFENWFDEHHNDKINELPQKRIPSTWITSRTTTPTRTTTTTTSRPTLRTLPSTVRVRTIPTEKPIQTSQRPVVANRIFIESTTQKPFMPTTVYPLERRRTNQEQRPSIDNVQRQPNNNDQRQPIDIVQRMPVDNFPQKPVIREYTQSPLPSSSFRPFQSEQQSGNRGADNTFRISTERTFRISTESERTFQTSTVPERTSTTAIRTFPDPTTTSSAPTLSSSSATRTTTTRFVLPSSITASTAASINDNFTGTTSRPSIFDATNAGASTRYSSPARDSTSTPLLPSIQSTQRPSLSNPSIPAVQVSSVSISTNPVQSLPTTNFNQQPFLQPAAPSFFNFLPQQQPAAVNNYRTPIIQRPSLSINDPNLIDNFFVPRNGPIRRSINQLFDTTGQAFNSALRTFFNG
ncbi:hypothetical protein PVAND_012956 [Polypedilum vanderplanki]|uniref:Insect pheromone-binding family n=1 Tax=Polypedilum vanderplanki TaxID=319348 RepID=A0A9J6CN17_POLVA|nr:hypothetical protein PVAND_012956 [Polypedilum vanderplanki]